MNIKNAFAMTYRDGLQSERLVTRFVTAQDADTWVEYCADPEATKFTSVSGMSPAEMAVAVIATTLKRYEDGLMGLQALINRQTGDFIGQCGVLAQVVDGAEEIEVGYHLLRRYWKQGYATEAARLFRDYAFENKIADSVISMIDPQNHASIAVALRNGMRLENTDASIYSRLSGRTLSGYHLYRITRAEWEVQKAGGA